MKKKTTAASIGLMLALMLMVVPVLAAANPVVYADFQAGNAAFECGQIGEFLYAWKIAEGSGEGAPNGSELAVFYDLEGNVVHSNTITIANSDGKVFDWSSSPNGVGAVIVKAGTGANVWLYDPQVKSDTGLYAYTNKDISHVTFCWNPDYTRPGEWCSPGYWRQPHHLDSWEATGISPDVKFYDKLGYYPKVSKLGTSAGATTNPTLWQVLQSPQWYGGDAFNAVGDLLSDAHPDVNYDGFRVEDSCPLN